MDIIINKFNNLNIGCIVENLMNEMTQKVIISNELELEKLKKIIEKKSDYDIDNETSLKSAHIFCLTNNIQAQVAGILIEKFIIKHYQMIKNNASSNIGDASLFGINYEIKVSMGV
jgi:hypothetical protein